MPTSLLIEPVPLSDWVMLVVLGVVIGLLIGGAELLRRWRQWPTEFTRKLIHVSVGIIAILMLLMLKTALPVLIISAIFAVFNWLSVRRGWLPAMHGSRHSYGTAYYPLSIFLLALFCWPAHKIIMIAALLVLAIADAAAAIVGSRIKRPHRYQLLKDAKSREGSLTMLTMSMVVISATLFYFGPSLWNQPLSPISILVIALLTAVVSTIAESMSCHGSDNLTVPMATALVLYYLLENGNAAIPGFAAGVVMGGLAAWGSFRLHFLSPDGAVAMWLLAIIIFGFGGWMWTVPIVTFFVLSSILSKVGKAHKSGITDLAERGDRRDAVQVGANGLIAGMIMTAQIFFPDSSLYTLYIVSLAAATADTWSTEIGGMFGHKPRSIIGLEPVIKGTSGGITFWGIVGGITGAAVIGASGFLFTASPAVIIKGAIFGTAGTIIDSLLGASLQAHYQCPVCGQMTEKRLHCRQSTNRVSGLSWMNNDMVNLFSIVLACALSLILS